jgi:hypothetical protein
MVFASLFMGVILLLETGDAGSCVMCNEASAALLNEG